MELINVPLPNYQLICNTKGVQTIDTVNVLVIMYQNGSIGRNGFLVGDGYQEINTGLLYKFTKEVNEITVITNNKQIKVNYTHCIPALNVYINANSNNGWKFTHLEFDEELQVYEEVGLVVFE